MVIPAIIAAATAVGTSIAGGIGSAKERKKSVDRLSGLYDENERSYRLAETENILNRADSQALLRNVRERLSDEAKAQDNMIAMTGATPESSAAIKKNNARAYTDAVSNISSMGPALKENAYNRYMGMKSNLINAQMGMDQDRASQNANLSGNASNILGSIISNPTMFNWSKKK